MPRITADIDCYDLAEALGDCNARELKTVLKALDDETSKNVSAHFEASPILDPAEVWQRIERALNARDFDDLALLLWPEVKARWPKPKLTPFAPAKVEQSA